MVTISARIDDKTKDSAEIIAENIGITLSAAINIFLKRFVAEEGFPFALKMQKETPGSLVGMTSEDITALFNNRIVQSQASPKLPPVSFLDLKSNTLVTK